MNDRTENERAELQRLRNGIIALQSTCCGESNDLCHGCRALLALLKSPEETIARPPNYNAFHAFEKRLEAAVRPEEPRGTTQPTTDVVQQLRDWYEEEWINGNRLTHERAMLLWSAIRALAPRETTQLTTACRHDWVSLIGGIRCVSCGAQIAGRCLPEEPRETEEYQTVIVGSYKEDGTADLCASKLPAGTRIYARLSRRSPLEPARELSASEAASFEEAFANSPRRHEPAPEKAPAPVCGVTSVLDTKCELPYGHGGRHKFGKSRT